VSDVRHLFVQKYYDSAFLFTLEQLGSCSSAYSIPLDDHPEFFKRLAASPLQPSQAIVVFFAFSYYVP
jgi:hypothetical protein